MKPPLYVRQVTEEEKEEIEKGLKAKEGFKVRRSQMIKLSSERKRVKEIGQILGCSGQAVREAIREFGSRGVKSLDQQSNRPKSAKKEIGEQDLGKLKELVNESPRKYGKKQSQWTLPILAEVSYEKGITKRLMSDESIRLAIKRLGINWKRAKEWITSPDEGYERKKKKRQDNKVG
jgi:transposase